MTMHLRIFVIATILISASALALPYINRELAIMQLRSSFPGLFPQSRGKVAGGSWKLIQHETTRTSIGHRVMVSIENTSPANVLVTSVDIKCVMFDAQGTPRAIGTTYVSRVRPGDKEFAEVDIITEQSASKIDCSGWAGFRKME